MSDKGWLTLSEASERSGISTRHLRRRCPRWKTMGLARQVTGRRGRPGWLVHQRADLRMMPVKDIFSNQDLRRYRQSDRAEAFRRLEVLQQWRAAVSTLMASGLTKDQATEQFCSSNSPCAGRTTLYRWDAAFRTSGITSLLPGYTTAGDTDVSDQAVKHFRQLYLDLRQPSVKACWQQVAHLAKQHGLAWFNSLRTCQAWVLRTFTKPELVLNRQGQGAYTAICAPYIQRDPDHHEGNECWIGDHHQLDLWCTYQGKLLRPWITAWQDMRSRVIVGWVLCPQPNQSTILAALRGAIVQHGPPVHCVIDNGKDYDSYAFTGTTKARRKKALAGGYLDEPHVKGLFGQLNITVTLTIPYSPQSKPIERTFRTIEDQFCRTFATYTGNSPAARPENLQAILQSSDAIPSFEDVQKKLTSYIDTVYHVTAHQGTGMDGRPPLEVLRQTQTTRRVMADNTVLDLLLQIWSQPFKVGKHGVRFRSVNYGSGMPELVALQGDLVRVAYDPADVSVITVWDLDGRLICRPRAAQLVAGTSDEALRAAMRQHRLIRKTLNNADRVRRHAHRDVSELAVAAAAQAAQDQLDNPLDAAEISILQPVRTDFDAALSADVNPFKKAVGDDTQLITEQDLFDQLSSPDQSQDNSRVDIDNALETQFLKLTDGQ